MSARLCRVALPESCDWGMHLTPEAPRSSIRALEDYSRTLGSFKSASPSGFKVNRCRPPAGRNERRAIGPTTAAQLPADRRLARVHSGCSVLASMDRPNHKV